MSTPPRLRALWRVSSPYTAPVTIRATDWISALGAALYQLGRTDQIERMACERLPNGEVIVNDLTLERRYVVQKLADATDLPEDELEADDEITEVGLRPLSIAVAGEELQEEDDSEEVLAMGGGAERADPFSGWGMSLAVEDSEELDADEYDDDSDEYDAYDDDSDEMDFGMLGEEEPASVGVRLGAAAPAAGHMAEEVPADVLTMAPAIEAIEVGALEANDPDSEATVILSVGDLDFDAIAAPDESDDDSSEELPPDDNTLAGERPRRGIVAALKQLRLRRGDTTP